MKYFLILLLVFLSTVHVLAGQRQQFFDVLYDVPIMPGLEELPEQALVFDKPSGRIAQVEALAPDIDAREIERFYRESLPQMGWKTHAKGVYSRAGQKLQITVQKTEKPQIVRFALTPQ